MPTDPTVARVEIIGSKHLGSEQLGVCWSCGKPWPCDTAEVLTALAAAEQRAARLVALVERLRDLAHFSSDAYSHQYAEYIDAEMAAVAEVDRPDAS